LIANIRSIQSFDSKYDTGRLAANSDQQPFANFTQQENQGKMLFFQPANFNNQGVRIGGGIGCVICHQAPEFAIAPISQNNGVTANANGIGTDFTNTRAPSLRDAVKANGDSNGPFMHTGASHDLNAVLDHYNTINAVGNPNLDQIFIQNGNGQQLNLTTQEREAIISFISTLGGTDVYTNEKWSNPFIN